MTTKSQSIENHSFATPLMGLLCLAALAAPSAAQAVVSSSANAGAGGAGVPRIAVRNPSTAGPRGSGGLDPLSPEVGVLVDAGDVGRYDPSCAPIVDWPSLDLGVPPGGNVDAISDFRDVVPAYGPASPNWPPPGREVVMGFSVDRASPGYARVREEWQTDGAAGDVFGSVLTPQPGLAYVVTDADCLSIAPGPLSDVDSILRSKIVRYPVFYSVDAATAAAMGVSPADILVVTAAGAPPIVVLTEADLGLVPGDDVDALAMGGEGVVFSLRRGSPTAAAFPLVGSGGIFAMGATPWMLAFQCNLDPTDDLNALAIGDPEIQHAGSVDLGRGLELMCKDPGTGATDQTSLWRVYDLQTYRNGWIVSDVEIGIGGIDSFFDVQVNLFVAPTPDPLGPKTLVGTSNLLLPPLLPPGEVLHFPFPDVNCGNEFLWVELVLPPAPLFPASGQIFPLVTELEQQPTFVSSACNPQLIDLDATGLPDLGLFQTVSGFEDPDFILLMTPPDLQQPFLVTAIGLNPFEQADLFFGINGPGNGPCLPPFDFLCLDFLGPEQFLGPMQVGPLGIGTQPLLLPPGLTPGVDLMLQALTPRGPGGVDSVKSNAARGTAN